jgi:hypothetical protein
MVGALLSLAAAAALLPPSSSSTPPTLKLHVLGDLLQARAALHGPSPSALLSSSWEMLLAQADDKAKAAQTWSVMSKNITIPGVSKHNYISSKTKNLHFSFASPFADSGTVLCLSPLRPTVPVGIYNHPCNAQPTGCKAYPGGTPLPMSECDNSTGLPYASSSSPPRAYCAILGDSG